MVPRPDGRQLRLSGPQRPPRPGRALRCHDLQLDPLARTLRRGDELITLSPCEFDLLHLLLRRGGRAVAPRHLVRVLHLCGGRTRGASVGVHIHRLRRKIGPELIWTLRGAGYAMPAARAA